MTMKTKTIKWIVFSLLVSLFVTVSFSPGDSFVIPAYRHASTGAASILPSHNDASLNWQKAGMAAVGGIPSRTTVCATVNPIGGGSSDFTNIQNAINACPAGQVVQLGSGAFSVQMSDLPIRIPTGIVLRGTGSCTGSSSPHCATSITVSDGLLFYEGGNCGTTAPGSACSNGGASLIEVTPAAPSYNYSWAQCGNIGGPHQTGDSCGAVSLGADAAKGDTTIRVSQTSGLSVGDWVLIDEASGAGWVADPMNAVTGFGSIWAASDWLNSSGSPATGRVSWPKAQNLGWNNGWDFGASGDNIYPTTLNSAGCQYSYCDRVTNEMHKISAIGGGSCPGAGCTVTFDSPLTIAYRQSGSHNAQIYRGPYLNQAGSGSPVALIENAGVENLSLLRAPNGGIRIQFCVYCWVKNVEVGNWYNGGISIDYSARVEINAVYIHHCWHSVNSGGEYPIALDQASTEILITNSIINFAGKGMVARAGGAGSVVSYNYVDDTMYDQLSGIGNYWVDMGVNASHFAGPHHVLFEGNWGNNLDSDNTHGNAVYITFFRNHSTALRTAFNDPSIPGTPLVDDYGGTGYSSGNNAVGGISGTTLTLSSVSGAIYVGSYLTGYTSGVTAGTHVTAQLSGTPNGPGTYTVTPSQTVAGGTSFYLYNPVTPGPLRAVGPMSYNYWFAVVGNVLGEAGKTTAANGWTYQGDWSGKRIFMLGWNTGPGGQDPYLNGVSGSYIYISGNYDYVNAGVTWADANHTLPNSYYLSSAPSFFTGGSCTYSWPWVTPTGSPQIQQNSCSGSGLPALARWNAGTPFVHP
jgi:hypothetical protein